MDESERFGWMVEEQKRHIESEKKKMLHNYLQVQHEQKEHQKKHQNAMKEHEMKLNLSTLVDGGNGQGHSISPAITSHKDKSRYSTLDVDAAKYYARPTPGDTFRLDPHRLNQL
jgi:hypothetical protein